ncbi:hypothetical protein GA830_17675 [Mesorhizobium sp. NBSH29]|uniref:hypothetical protein n=1 Tax=Mesorhizobium sp. NBSH29 TaxID=2654249 RepID=UPI0018969FC9|nr:hypothetical protein [Mesorhizobium sp. NBSH29]QPC88378.1 hypothetical protein GA830_17675 [Mesorhizobium sp. NBSH29]
MLRYVLSALLITVALPAMAQPRYTSTSLSCAQVTATIKQDGAAQMRYRSTRNPSLPLYGRYVRDTRFCRSGERAETVFIPSADRKSCPVLECKTVDRDDDFRILRLRRD